MNPKQVEYNNNSLIIITICCDKPKYIVLLITRLAEISFDKQFGFFKVDGLWYAYG